MAGTKRERSRRDHTVLVIIGVLWLVATAAGARFLQLRRIHEEWAIAHPDLWRIQFPDEAAGASGPPQLTSWPLYAVMVVIVALLAGLAGWAAYGIFKGDDAPHFEDHDAGEQQRRRDAGQRLGLGLPSAPPVANTLATREGRLEARFPDDPRPPVEPRS